MDRWATICHLRNSNTSAGCPRATWFIRTNDVRKSAQDQQITSLHCILANIFQGNRGPLYNKKYYSIVLL